MSILAATALRLILARLNKKLEAGVTIGNDGKMRNKELELEARGFPGMAADRGFRFLL